jgi:acyl carrier protein
VARRLIALFEFWVVGRGEIMESDIKSQIKKMIADRLFLEVEPEEIADNAPLMETYGIDSVALFELVVGLEDEFGVVMEDADFQIDTFKTVDSIAAFVEEKQAS